MREAEAQRQLALKQADADLIARQTAAIREERRRLAQLPIEQRRSVLKAPPKNEATEAPKVVATFQPLSLAPVDAKALASNVSIGAPRLTPEEVRAKWWWFLTALAIAECAASVLAGAILAGVWEWDRNHDGIPDHLQQPTGVGTPREIAAGK
jgi:hypothetical protein